MSFFKELQRRSVFRVAMAYLVVAWLLLQVGSTLGPALHLPVWVDTLLAFFVISIVHADESIQRLPELSLLAGSSLSYLAATAPVAPTGFCDRQPKRSPGRAAGC